MKPHSLTPKELASVTAVDTTIFEVVIYCGALKHYRILNLYTGSLYSMHYETQGEADAAIDDGEVRTAQKLTVRRTSLPEIRAALTLWRATE